MNKKDFIKELINYNSRVAAIEAQREALCRLKAKLYHPGAQVFDGGAKGSVSYEDRIVDMLDKEREISQKLEYNVLMLGYIDKILDSLPQSGRELVKMRYIDGYEIDNICRIQHISRRTFNRRVCEVLGRVEFY